ncbi:hypothetical protein GUITHDRAFT_113764 [Guillardia theta CCMP2712]|uniref:GRAM domain-containing protein n=1 Tax=Guillardia theta (strain CCMP2712) TaxID=905079 RepID=L1IV89_GUITC|nr:hypothetical protein GUITHDRAFT_113764 [Guillardia theta CCMP2712]EKX40027.1 hypothetical protein GUITHDRAFT_113764 [Guillardia theta CCMP2712]|eukprot:XP_005827007.1 hypothetical protein GUITHDRAFT_113764 [Guillardia theta CCMP2712]
MAEEPSSSSIAGSAAHRDLSQWYDDVLDNDVACVYEVPCAALLQLVVELEVKCVQRKRTGKLTQGRIRLATNSLIFISRRAHDKSIFTIPYERITDVHANVSTKGAPEGISVSTGKCFYVTSHKDGPWLWVLGSSGSDQKEYLFKSFVFQESAYQDILSAWRRNRQDGSPTSGEQTRTGSLKQAAFPQQDGGSSSQSGEIRGSWGSNVSRDSGRLHEEQPASGEELRDEFESALRLCRTAISQLSVESGRAEEEEKGRKRQEEEEARRKIAEEGERRKTAEEEKRKKAEEEERRRKAEEEDRRRKAEEEERKTEEMEKRRKLEEEDRRKKAEEDAERKAAEAENARKEGDSRTRHEEQPPVLVLAKQNSEASATSSVQEPEQSLLFPFCRAVWIFTCLLICVLMIVYFKTRTRSKIVYPQVSTTEPKDDPDVFAISHEQLVDDCVGNFSLHFQTLSLKFSDSGGFAQKLLSRNLRLRIQQFCEITVFEGNVVPRSVAGTDPNFSSTDSSSWQRYLEKSGLTDILENYQHFLTQEIQLLQEKFNLLQLQNQEYRRALNQTRHCILYGGQGSR